MAFDLNVRIDGAIPAQFVPQGGIAGTPLLANAGDNVSWGNDTKATHQPWPTKQNGDLLTAAEISSDPSLFLSDEIPRDEASSPWRVAASSFTGKVIFYCCKRHKGEVGSIVIID
jgi:hypothetical protein